MSKFITKFTALALAITLFAGINITEMQALSRNGEGSSISAAGGDADFNIGDGAITISKPSSGNGVNVEQSNSGTSASNVTGTISITGTSVNSNLVIEDNVGTSEEPLKLSLNALDMKSNGTAIKIGNKNYVDMSIDGNSTLTGGTDGNAILGGRNSHLTLSGNQKLTVDSGKDDGIDMQGANASLIIDGCQLVCKKDISAYYMVMQSGSIELPEDGTSIWLTAYEAVAMKGQLGAASKGKGFVMNGGEVTIADGDISLDDGFNMTVNGGSINITNSWGYGNKWRIPG